MLPRFLRAARNTRTSVDYCVIIGSIEGLQWTRKATIPQGEASSAFRRSGSPPPRRPTCGPASASGRTACWRRSARAAWARSGSPSRSSRSAAASPSRSSSWAWTAPRVIARFEAERQALALMDHPSIARVYDAGATRHGRPYFVMEHVSTASPITDYCDRQQLTIWHASSCSCRSARACSTRTRRGSFTATSNRPTFWSRSATTAGAEDHRLRRRQGDRESAHRANDVHGDRRI